MVSKGMLKLIKENEVNPREIYDIMLDNKKINAKAIEVNDFLYLTDKDVENIEKEINEKCEFIIIATHKSETQIQDTISIHVCGNINKNELGGEENKFSNANINAFDYFYNFLSNEKNNCNNLKFFVEATHHGPTLNRDLMYYEIGPNENAYQNKEYQEYYIKLLLNYLNAKHKENTNPIILIGAQHYLDIAFINNIKDEIKTKYNVSNIVLAHIIPKYSLNILLNNDDEKIKLIFQNMINASKTNKIILNKEYMKSLTRIKEILEKLNCEIYII